MAAYYNELDPFAAAWLRELIKAKLIADGEVDERSIADVSAADVRGFTQCHFFAGIGGWSYALRLAGWPDEREVWTGSCPCQPWSVAGNGGGTSDPRHLWPAWYGLICQSRPRLIFGEQVDSKDGRFWLDIVHDNLEHVGYAIGSVGLPACSVGAPHNRPRLWFVAHPDGERLPPRHERGESRTTDAAFAWRQFERVHAAGTWKAWSAFSTFSVFTDGIPARVAKTRGFGNAIVPQVAQIFIESYCEARDLTLQSFMPAGDRPSVRPAEAPDHEG